MLIIHLESESLITCLIEILVFGFGPMIQFLKEKKFEQVIPPAKVEDANNITSEIATNALRKGVNFLSALQASDGHWPAENAGPLFFLPPLVCLYLL